MTGLDPGQLLTYVVQPVLHRLRVFIPPTLQAERIVLGTAITESKLVYLDQRDRAGKPGPAYGPWQVERLTYTDLMKRAPAGLKEALRTMFAWDGSVRELHGNLFLGAAVCRLKYFMCPEAIPRDPLSMAQLWKLRYNTPLGAGTVEKARPDFELACSL